MLDRLVAAAREARANAYAPYTDFAVGAAVLAGDRVFPGANVENAASPLSICAERAAVTAAVAAGFRGIDALVLVGSAADPTPPCGGCRQVLAEFGADAVVVSEADDGARREWTLAELLPDAFGPGQLS